VAIYAKTPHGRADRSGWNIGLASGNLSAYRHQHKGREHTMRLSRIALACVLVVFAGGSAAQQAFPSKPIRFIIPYPPGGGTTIVAHLIGPKLTEIWGQPVVVENRPGGNTVIGHDAMLRLPPDGHGIVMSSSTFVLNALLLKLPYEPFKDFAPVTTLYNSQQVLTVTPSLPANNLKELIALAKSKPGELNYATVSSGGSTHLASELLNMMAGIKTQQVNYKGAGPALTDQMSGHVQLAFTAPAAALSFIKSGKLRAIAISGDKRTPALAQVPTFAEAGLPGFEATLWFGVQTHGGTPKETVSRLSSDLARVINQPDISEKLVAQATEPYTMTPERFAARIKGDTTTYARVIKAANIKIE
jgi:tripartite-type tricarboxylate transporter receptor subunit TctC